jgi:hypothetical protein
MDLSTFGPSESFVLRSSCTHISRQPPIDTSLLYHFLAFKRTTLSHYAPHLPLANSHSRRYQRNSYRSCPLAAHTRIPSSSVTCRLPTSPTNSVVSNPLLRAFFMPSSSMLDDRSCMPVRSDQPRTLRSCPAAKTNSSPGSTATGYAA